MFFGENSAFPFIFLQEISNNIAHISHWKRSQYEILGEYVYLLSWNRFTKAKKSCKK